MAYRPMSKVDRAITAGNEALGFIKLVYAKDGAILGATVMGPSAGELISEISVAMAGKVKLPALASIMHAYPTVSIALQQMAAEVYYDQVRRSGPDPTLCPSLRDDFCSFEGLFFSRMARPLGYSRVCLSLACVPQLEASMPLYNVLSKLGL